MYNYMRRCLIVSIKFHRTFLTQSVHENILSRVIDSHVNIHWSKRSYCQATIQQIDRTNINIKEKFQQEFDEFLSNPENKKVFEILKLEINVLRHNAEKVPEKIEPRDWLTLLKTTSKTQRKRYLRFLWLNEMTAINQKAKKELKKTEALAKKAEQIEDTGEMRYGLLYNTLFLRIYESTMNRYYNGRVFQAMMFEPKIVFDCGYEEYMSPREIHACAKQLTLSFAANRLHINPMSLYFCNMNEAGSLLQQCNIIMPNLLDDDCPLTVTSQSYLDLFPKNQLIYLTPHCKVNMTEYNPEMVYIIGAIVDKQNQQPLSLAKAKKEGIQMAKLPLENYLPWGTSSGKSLTINQMMDILLQLRHTKDWKEALQYVPTRKLKSAREHMLRLKLEKILHNKEAKTDRSERAERNFEKEKIEEKNILNSDSLSERQTDFTFASRKANKLIHNK